jgi:hypothetical protein
VDEDLTKEQIQGLDVHYVKTIEEALMVSLPAVAQAAKAKEYITEPPKDSPQGKDKKSEAPAIRPTQEPAVVHDRVVTAEA